MEAEAEAEAVVVVRAVEVEAGVEVGARGSAERVLLIRPQFTTCTTNEYMVAYYASELMGGKTW